MADSRTPSLIDIENYMAEKGKSFQEAVQDLIARAEGMSKLRQPVSPDAPQGIERKFKNVPDLPMNDGLLAPPTGNPVPDPRRLGIPAQREPDKMNVPLKNYGVSQVRQPGQDMSLTEWEAFAKSVADSDQGPPPDMQVQPRFEKLKNQLMREQGPAAQPEPQGMIELSEDPEEMQRQIEATRLGR